jgi:hypothetical protein
MDRNWKKWGARFLIGMVLFFNVECAAAFLIAPDLYSPGFELNGEVGRSMVRGLGILFLMWNIPYLFALLNPSKNKSSTIETILMQAIGFVGESLLFAFLSPAHPVIKITIQRFIIFDGSGLLALILAAWLIFYPKKMPADPSLLPQ